MVSKFKKIYLLALLFACCAQAFELDMKSVLHISAFDARSQQLVLYDEARFVSVVDLNLAKIVAQKRLSDNQITATAFDNGRIYAAFLGLNIALFDSKLNLQDSFKINASGVRIEQIKIHNSEIYAIFDKKNIIKFNPQTKTQHIKSQGYGRINSLSFQGTLVWAGGWQKQLACYDANLTQIAAQDIKNIATSIMYCDADNTLYAGDIHGNFTNTKDNTHFNLGEQITQIAQGQDVIYIATEHKIFKQDKNSIKEVFKTENEILSIYVADELVVVTKNGKIYKFNEGSKNAN